MSLGILGHSPIPEEDVENDLAFDEPYKETPRYDEPYKETPLYDEPYKETPRYDEPYKETPRYDEPYKEVSNYEEPYEEPYNESFKELPTYKESSIFKDSLTFTPFTSADDYKASLAPVTSAATSSALTYDGFNLTTNSCIPNISDPYYVASSFDDPQEEAYLEEYREDYEEDFELPATSAPTSTIDIKTTSDMMVMNLRNLFDFSWVKFTFFMF